MQLQLVQATRETRQLDEIVRAFTAPMRRVCPHMSDAALRAMIERMALQQLADERHRHATAGHGMRRRVTRPRSLRNLGGLHVC